MINHQGAVLAHRNLTPESTTQRKYVAHFGIPKAFKIEQIGSELMTVKTRCKAVGLFKTEHM